MQVQGEFLATGKKATRSVMAGFTCFVVQHTYQTNKTKPGSQTFPLNRTARLVGAVKYPSHREQSDHLGIRAELLNLGECQEKWD